MNSYNSRTTYITIWKQLVSIVENAYRLAREHIRMANFRIQLRSHG